MPGIGELIATLHEILQYIMGLHFAHFVLKSQNSNVVMQPWNYFFVRVKTGTKASSSCKFNFIIPYDSITGIKRQVHV
jgi:hypothetical protein